MKDILMYVVAKYIDFDTFKELIFINKFYYSNKRRFMIKFDIQIEAIRSRLREMNIDVEELNKFLISTNSVVAGSFPLQCILNKKWDSDSDIDIFLNMDDFSFCMNYYNYTSDIYNYKWLEDYFPKNKLIINRCSTMKSTTFYENKKKIKQIARHSEENLNNITRYNDTDTDYIFNEFIGHIILIIDGKLNNNKVQFIFNSSNYGLAKYNIFMNFFDLEMCKIGYNGISLIGNNYKKNPLLFEYNFDCEHFIKLYGLYHYKRHDYHYINNIKFFMSKAFNRIDKYRKRGFKISIKNVNVYNDLLN